MNMVVLGVALVNLSSNQRVTEVYPYTVTMMNSHLWNKALIPKMFPQIPILQPV